MTQPRYSLLAAWPLAWSANTNGPVNGEPVFAPIPSSTSIKKGEADLAKYVEKYQGKLRGKVVLVSETLNNIVQAESKPDLRRYTDAELADLAIAPPPTEKMKMDPADLDIPEDLDARIRFFSSAPPSVMDEYRTKRNALALKRAKFFADEGALALLQDDARARDGLTFSEAAGSYEAKDPLAPPTFVVTSEHYNRIARLLATKTKVEMQVNLKARMSDGDVDSYNVIAEIPGGNKKDEVDDGGGANSEGAESQNGPHNSHRTVGRGRGRPAGIESLREGALCRSQDHAAPRRPLEIVGIFQSRQRKR